ncbi:hypothetical protein ACVWY6_001261 [Williamsia sp. R60]
MGGAFGAGEVEDVCGVVGEHRQRPIRPRREFENVADWYVYSRSGMGDTCGLVELLFGHGDDHLHRQATMRSTQQLVLEDGLQDCFERIMLTLRPAPRITLCRNLNDRRVHARVVDGTHG